METWNVEALKEEIDRLRREVAELRASRKRLVVAADADRRAIERHIHGTVSPQMVALAVNLQRMESSIDADPAAAKELLEEMKRDVEQELAQTARLAQRIYPALLNAAGLGAALRSAAADAGIRVSLDVPAGAKFPTDVVARIYFCCLEAFEYVGGRSVTVTVREEEEALRFAVVADGDDVVPSMPTETPSDVRLDVLRDRVEGVDGELQIRLGPGGGLRLIGSLPLS